MIKVDKWEISEIRLRVMRVLWKHGCEHVNIWLTCITLIGKNPMLKVVTDVDFLNGGVYWSAG